MDKPLTQLKYFFQLAEERELSGADQLLWFHLFNRFNKQNWKGTLKIKDAELRDLMKLYNSDGKPMSVTTIRRARQRLKTKGFIEFSSGGGYATTYQLINLAPDVSEEVKPIQKVSAPSPSDKKNDVPSVNELDHEIFLAWIAANEENPFGGNLRDLITLQKSYGAQKVADAINSCRRKQSFGNFIGINFISAELARGGEKIVKFPATTKSEPVNEWEHERLDSWLKS